MMECSLEIKPYNAKKVMQWYVIKMETEQSRPVRKTCLITSFSTSETEQALGEGQNAESSMVRKVPGACSPCLVVRLRLEET